jgi:homotetrameric cytidine deaminase
MKTSVSISQAHQAALQARTHAHAPYSKFKVGAALQLKGKREPVTGCNVENASFGGTICAERVAVQSAVARFGRIDPEFLVIVTDEKEATVPCALCLQVLAEFCGDDFPIYLGNEKGLLKKYTLRELLPHPFRSFQVKAKKK